MEKFKEFFQTTFNAPPTIFEWPNIGSSLVNEYNIEGLFNLASPTLFPNEDALPHQPRIKNIPLDSYVVHLMRYHYNIFGSHPRFIYYLYKLIIHHMSQTKTNLFVK